MAVDGALAGRDMPCNVVARAWQASLRFLVPALVLVVLLGSARALFV